MQGIMAATDEIQFVPSDYFRRAKVEEMFPGRADRPLEVDLGCGDGGFLLEMAAQYPERNFLGVERLLGRVRKVCRKAARGGLSNLKVLRLESAYTVEWLLPKNSVSRVHLLFPDPWPKKRHQRRRLVTPEFLESVADLLTAGGEFCFKTDDDEYFEVVNDAVRNVSRLAPEKWDLQADSYAETDFERQWRGAGREILRLRCRSCEGGRNREGRAGV